MPKLNDPGDEYHEPPSSLYFVARMPLPEPSEGEIVNVVAPLTQFVELPAIGEVYEMLVVGAVLSSCTVK